MTVKSKKHKHPALRLFLPFAIVFGLSMVFLTPPFQSPDEPAHFFRAYQVSDLTFAPVVKNNATGGYLPKSLLITLDILNPGKLDYRSEDYAQKFREARLLPLNRTEKDLLFFPNMALYNPVLYIPQATGIAVGKLFNLSPLYMLYLARLFNLLFWILLIYQAIKWVPFNKWLVAALALTPMAIFLAGSANADTTVMAYLFVFLAYVLKVAFGSHVAFDWKNLLILTLLSMLVALSKNIYVVVSALVLIIPVSRASGKKDYLLKLSVFFTFTLLTSVLSYLFIQSVLGQIETIELYYGGEPFPLINPDKQIAHILSDIPGFISMVFYSFSDSLQVTIMSYIGILGWLNIIFPGYYYIFALLALLFFALFSDQKKISIGWKRKVFLIGILTAILLAFSFTMYCSWNNPGDSRITNLQGRYFIPVAPLAWLVFQNKKFQVPGKFFPIILSTFALISMVLSVRLLLLHFYF
jgi:uncharacterized membrane protein